MFRLDLGSKRAIFAKKRAISAQFSAKPFAQLLWECFFLTGKTRKSAKKPKFSRKNRIFRDFRTFSRKSSVFNEKQGL